MLELLDDIVAGSIPAASWLPRVEDIAARHAASPAAAREAIRALEERGVVEVHQGRGQRVLPADRWDLLDPDVTEAVILRHRDIRLLRDAVQAFTVVEIQAARAALRRQRAGDVRYLGELLDRMRRAEGFTDAEAEFHRTLVGGSGNRWLPSMVRELHATLARLRRRMAPDRDHAVVQLHEQILAAVEARDDTAVAKALDDYGRHLASWLRV